ncbi:kinase-like domain-containing protein [Cristinia sonorae]|uniref:Kinase-like domain-containing protein n=1 Tax=Cristinia sonorae TaxID=1940300 RepID=A0A8K0UPJ2_9AGAR|nr:kinase-like domain-containing protein [Cristinia sonorae]
MSDPQVYAMVLTGKRPPRPSNHGAEVMSDALWDLIEWCWSERPSTRPTAEQCLGAILAATGGVLSPHPGQPESPMPWHIRQSTSSEHLLVYLRLQGVQPPTHTDAPFTGGRSSNIFIGKYRGQKVALRRFRMFMRAGGDSQLYDMIYASALKWKELQHKHVLPFLGIDVTSFERGMSMVFPWKNYGNVRGFISKLRAGNRFGNGSGWLIRWIHQVGRGLAYLHSEHVVHGALRGSNVLIDEEWGVRLADYDQAGILLQLGEDTSSRAEEAAHRVLRWMPPEICEGAHITTTTDIYSFACLCLEMYTCKDPFAEVTGETRFTRSLASGALIPIRPSVYDGACAEVPDSLWALMEECWKRQPMQRPTATQLVQRLSSNGQN